MPRSRFAIFDFVTTMTLRSFRALIAAPLLLSGTIALSDDVLDLRASFKYIAPYTSLPSQPVARGFSIPGPGTIRMTTTLSPWFRSSEPVLFRSLVPVDGRDEGAWTGHVPGVERVSSTSTPERWVDGADLTIVTEYRARKARPSLEVGLFPSTTRYGDGSVEQHANAVQVTIEWRPDASTSAAGEGLAGRWLDGQEPITLRARGDSVTGDYPFRDGRLSGTVSGRRFTGTWRQSESGRRCAESRDGTFYWGRFDLTLEGDRLEGRWGYCDGPVDAAWSWTRAAQSATAQPAPTAPPAGEAFAGRWLDGQGTITLRARGDSITGDYPFRDGRLSGTVSGRRFTGLWLQSESARRCTDARDGTFYWGRFDLTLEGDRLEGRFGYCDGPIDGPWTWTRSR